MVSVLVVVCGTAVVAALLGFSTPIGEPAYTGNLVAHDVALSQIEENSLNVGAAATAAEALVRFQDLPIVNVSFAYPFYVVVFVIFLIYGFAKRDWRALIVGIPQIAIFALSLIDSSHSTLAFIIPAMAAQIMFFGALTRNTQVIGDAPADPTPSK